MKPLAALLLCCCSFEVPDVTTYACGMATESKELPQPSVGCWVARASGNARLSRSGDVCEDGTQCLVLRPSDGGFRFHRPGAASVVSYDDDPHCTATCP